MRKRIFTIAMAGVLSLSLMGSVSAAAQQTVSIVSSPNTVAEITPRAEEKEWIYRIVDGKMQKRQWSLTEGKWLTDWIDM